MIECSLDKHRQWMNILDICSVIADTVLFQWAAHAVGKPKIREML